MSNHADDPEACPSWYDGCNCLNETQVHAIKRANGRFVDLLRRLDVERADKLAWMSDAESQRVRANAAERLADQRLWFLVQAATALEGHGDTASIRTLMRIREHLDAYGRKKAPG